MSRSPQARLGSLTAVEAAALDDAAAQLGIGIEQLMEVAGFQVARCAWRMLHGRTTRIHVVAGRGHNGGDGLVAARYLCGWGCQVTAAVLSKPDGLDGTIGRLVATADEVGVEVTVSPAPAESVRGCAGSELVIDALLGTGLREPPRAPQAEVIASMTGTVLSVDVPSGLDAGTGLAPGEAVRATTTCTLAAMKRGLWTAFAREHTGSIVVADIGMPAAAWRRCGLTPPSAIRGGELRRVVSSGQP